MKEDLPPTVQLSAKPCSKEKRGQGFYSVSLCPLAMSTFLGVLFRMCISEHL